jgi:hypothetical protein
MLRCVALVRFDVSEEHIASIIRVTRTGELGRTLAVTSNRSMLLTQVFHGIQQPKLRGRNITLTNASTGNLAAALSGNTISQRLLL